MLLKYLYSYIQDVFCLSYTHLTEGIRHVLTISYQDLELKTPLLTTIPVV